MAPFPACRELPWLGVPFFGPSNLKWQLLRLTPSSLPVWRRRSVPGAVPTQLCCGFQRVVSNGSPSCQRREFRSQQVLTTLLSVFPPRGARRKPSRQPTNCLVASTENVSWPPDLGPGRARSKSMQSEPCFTRSCCFTHLSKIIMKTRSIDHGTETTTLLGLSRSWRFWVGS